MKLLKAIALLALTVVGVRASGGEANNEITFYGCPEECSAQEGPSCPQFDDDDLPTNFAALSTKLPHYDDYCGHYAIYMKVDGSSGSKLGKATVVDSCSSCAKYHLDLSKKAFTKLVDSHKGTAKVIWGIYSKKGEKLAGPFYNSVSSAASKNGMSSDAFIAAFNANAKRLASSSDSLLSFSKNGVSSSDYVSSNKKTTTKRVTSIVRSNTAAAKNVSSNVTTRPQPFPLAPKNTQTTAKQVATVKQVGVAVTTTQAPKKVVQTPAPAKQAEKVEKAVEETNKNEGVDATTILAIGGGIGAAAGVGLLLMKKKSPSTYEGMKQSFPEAFTTVKRGLSRSATSIKRKVTKRETRQPEIMV